MIFHEDSNVKTCSGREVQKSPMYVLLPSGWSGPLCMSLTALPWWLVKGRLGGLAELSPGFPGRKAQSPHEDSGSQRVLIEQNLNFKGWNSQAHKKFPGKSQSSNLSRDTPSIGRLGVRFLHLFERVADGTPVRQRAGRNAVAPGGCPEPAVLPCALMARILTAA